MQTSLITGASGGIGEAFARRLAARGDNLFLVARSEDRLAAVCDEMTRINRVDARYLALDLGDAGAPRRVFEVAAERGLQVEMLINNAAFGSMGDFAGLNLETELAMIDLNIKALVALTHLFLPQMRNRAQGTIINVASTAAFQPVPYMTTYAATKAFVLSFSDALWEENRALGVRVMALCPGPTETNFFAAAGMKGPPPGRMLQTADEVVDVALRSLNRNKGHVISGWMNYLATESERLVPRSLVTRLIGHALRPMDRGQGTGDRGQGTGDSEDS